MNNQDNEKIKTILLKVPKPVWAFLKKRAVDTDTTMSDVVSNFARKAKKKEERRLQELNKHI